MSDEAGDELFATVRAERDFRLESAHARAERLRREQDEKRNLERVQYEAGERTWLEDPDCFLPFLGGPCDGQHGGPRQCQCVFCQGSHDTWPIRWRPDGWRDASESLGADWAERHAGEYVLNYVWLPDEEPV